MKVHGILSWYDESESWLGTATASLACFCDHILAVDGAYALYPGGKPRSHPNQAEAILHTAEAMGVACTIHRPSEVWWENEVEKRNKSLDIIGAFAEDGDWLCIFDADYHVVNCSPAGLRADLEQTECDVATYGLLDGEDWLSKDDLAETAAKQTLNTQWTSRIRDLYRWNPTLRVGPAHGDYSILGPNEDRVWLRGPYELEDAHDVTQFLTVYHRTKSRALTRQASQQGYYKMRDTLGVETLENASL